MKTLDEDAVQAVAAIKVLVERLVPDEPRIQLETIRLAAISHAIQSLSMARSEAYRSISWLLDELRDRNAEEPPHLHLVP